MRWVLMILFFSILSVPAVDAQDDPPPYIHYYDSLNRRLIIERADGSDSRAFDDVPGGAPSWSLTGKWMVVGQTMVISTDGRERKSLPEGQLYQDYRYLKWAPHDDVLVIVDRGGREGVIRAQIYDAEHDVILNEYSLQQIGVETPYNFELYWASDGSYVQVYWEYIDTQLLTLYRDGRTRSEFRVSWLHVPFDFERGMLLHSAIIDGDYVLALQDSASGKWMDVGPIFEGDWRRYSLYWDPTLNHALIWTRTCIDETDIETCEEALWLIDWQSGTFKPLAPVIQVPRPDRYCATNSPVYVCTQVWSPQGTYAILTAPEDAIYLIDSGTGQMRQISSDGVYKWTADEKLIFTNQETHTVEYYDPAAETSQSFTVAENVQLYDFSPSPEGPYIGLQSNPAMIINAEGETIVESTRHGHSTNSFGYPYYGYRWHSSEQWVMADYNIFFAGGGIGPAASIVFDLEGTVRRELPTRGAAGFVPERAIPYLAPGQPTSFIKEPVFTLPQAGIVRGVGWHPTDPDRLVTYSRDDGLVFWSLAEGTATITDQIILPEPYPDLRPADVLLYWLPEREIVAFYWQDRYATDGLYTMDLDTGEIVPVEDLVYPSIVETDAGVAAIVYSNSDETLLLDSLLADLNHRPFFLTSDRAGFIFNGLEPDYIPSYVDAVTGTITPLAQPGSYYAADARDGLVALGNVYSCCIQVMDKQTGEHVDTFYATAVSLAFSADGTRLATTAAGLTYIWDMSAYHD